MIVPVAGAGSSMSTLSVEISTTVSPCLTASPTLTLHSRIVPSVTDSPPVGVTMSTVWPVAASAAATPSASVVALATAAFGGRGRRRLAGNRRGAAPRRRRRRASPLVEISASTAPTATVSPSAAWIFTTGPAAGEGTSASTLSVEISTSVSSASTASPSCLCHSSTVPSATESPIAGMTTWTVPLVTAIELPSTVARKPPPACAGGSRPRTRSCPQTAPVRRARPRSSRASTGSRARARRRCTRATSRSRSGRAPCPG